MRAFDRRDIGSIVRAAVAVAATVSLVGLCTSGGGRSGPSDDLSQVLTPPSTDAVKLLERLQAAGARTPTTFTYYFYWYDAETGLHLQPGDPLPTKPAAEPLTSFRSKAWHSRQLTDMSDALVDVVLPVYWGEDPQEPWSALGLDVLVGARADLVAAGRPAPAIGMFYDTTIVRGLDLTTPTGMATFYGHVQSFFVHIPPEHRALVDGRPVVWLFLPQENRYDQRVFDHVSAQFERDFGVAPFLVREAGWKNVTTDASYVWGAAQNGAQATDLVVSVGPGYDERRVPGRSGAYRPRQDGRWYRRNLEAAMLSKRPLLAIETWNELHEASGIGETLEYGRVYIDITRELVISGRARPTVATG